MVPNRTPQKLQKTSKESQNQKGENATGQRLAVELSQ